MWRVLSIAVLSAFVSILLYARVVEQTTTGSERFSPTRIDWLITTLQANLREELTQERGFSMDFTFNGDDPDTVIIYVRYLRAMSASDREIMNMNIETARNVISTEAKRYGWNGWVKIKEDIKPASLTK